ncbi:zinc finger protein 79-like protein [Amazona aestiva]|uniref:Zinc finger protein 79-like protein n=2 Tax=Amazona TaxID=12929 RepID=A0A0Q3SIL4_AMAAE|nr:zinc finger protein 79-like protein [Amazona aestiva]
MEKQSDELFIRSVMISTYMVDALFLIQSVFAFQKERRRNCKERKGFSGGKECEQDLVFLYLCPESKMEPVIESVFCVLQEAGKSDIAGYTEGVQVVARPGKITYFTKEQFTCIRKGGVSDCSLTPSGDCILSNYEEEEGIPEDLKEDVLPQLPEARSPDTGPASLQRQQKEACNNPPHQKRGSRKPALIADSWKAPTEEKPYKCTECGKGFKGRPRLLNHMRAHTGVQMFECVECGKSFSRKASLMVHQRVHTGEKPYKCKECEKTFGRASNLAAHHKTHTRKKAFSCTACRKSFSGSAALFHHQKVHMDEKPFRCTECGNNFRLYSNFIKHQWIHLREGPSEQTAGN